MSNVLDMVTKCGFEAHSITDDSLLPCTLVRDGVPAGFLQADFTVTLLPGMEAMQEQLSKAVGFAVENAGFDVTQRGGYILTQYRDSTLAAEYDFTAQRPVYAVYGKEGATPLFSSESRESAAQYFSTASGLLSAQVDVPSKAQRLRSRLAGELTDLGYQLKEKTESRTRAFEIVNDGGDIVAYIGRDNKLQYVTNDTGERRGLSGAYRRADPDREHAPRGFDKLREAFARRGMTARSVHTPEGVEYDVRQDGRNVGYVSQNRTAQAAEPAVRTQIDRAMEEVQRDTGNGSPIHVVPPMPESAPPPAEPALHPQQEQAFTAQEVTALLLAVVSIKEIHALLPEGLAAKIDALAAKKPSEAKEVPQEQAIPEAEKEPELLEQGDEAPAQQEQQATLRETFLTQYNLLQTVKGFNSDKEKEIGSYLKKTFGTADPKTFEANLAQGKYAAGERSFGQRLDAAKQQAQATKQAPAAQRQEQERGEH